MLRKKRRISESIDDDPISDSPNTKDVSTADTFNETYSDAGGIEDSGYNEVGKVYEDPTTGKLVMVSG